MLKDPSVEKIPHTLPSARIGRFYHISTERRKTKREVFEVGH
jgi:hypothetical protein